MVERLTTTVEQEFFGRLMEAAILGQTWEDLWG